MPIQRNSKQRNAILAELKSRKDHPTADELYQALKGDNPALSLATVYRNLKQLVDDKQIICVKGETSDRFDATVAQHYHFACTNCHRVYDLNIPAIADINTAIGDYKGRVDSYSLIYSGICENCFKSIY